METTETAGTESMENAGCDDNSVMSTNIVDINTLPPNRAGATIDVIDVVDNVDSPATETSRKETDKEDKWFYCTVTRWTRRWLMFKDYLSSPEPKTFPSKTEYLFDKEYRDNNKQSVLNLIWGDDEDSLRSLHNDRLERLRVTVNQFDMNPCESSVPDTTASPSNEDVQGTQAPANPTLGTDNELSEVERLMEQLRLQLRQKDLQLLQKDQQHAQERLQDRQLLVQEREKRIVEREKRRVEREMHIEQRLGRLADRHGKVRNALLALAGHGNETAVTMATQESCGTPSMDEKRAENVEVHLPDLLVLDSEDDRNKFLTELMNKEVVDKSKAKLLALQDYVTQLLKNATKGKDKAKIQNTVNAILNWDPNKRAAAQLPSSQRFGWPPARGFEKDGDQPILWALIVRILGILEETSKTSGCSEHCSLSVISEQAVAPVARGGRSRRIDFVVDQYREFLSVIFPEMLGHAIEVKTTADDKINRFEDYQERAREQVKGHLARRLWRTLDFAGIGRNEIVHGVALSLISVQVLKMQVRKVGTDEVEIVLLETKFVPLLGEELPKSIGNRERWDMATNGVLLLASALVELPKDYLFNNNNDRELLRVKDVTQASYEPMQTSSHDIQCLLGSGSFAHVVKLGDEEFMKIPRSASVVKSLVQECEILKELNGEKKKCFPTIKPWGVSDVELYIHGEFSKLKVLRLTGIVGVTLAAYCRQPNTRVEDVITKVYVALEYAHAKGIVHMDVRPSNIIVKSQENGIDVLLADWGCGMRKSESIKGGGFVGCPPYAHDNLLGERSTKLHPIDDFDFASLGYTWYHVTNGVLRWRFDRPKDVSEKQIKDRETEMGKFVHERIHIATFIPKVFERFRQSDHRGRKRTSSVRDEGQAAMGNDQNSSNGTQGVQDF